MIFSRPHRQQTSPRRGHFLALEELEQRDLPSVLSPTFVLLHPLSEVTSPFGYTPSQISHAYGFDQITFTRNGQTILGDGSGQTIAIVDAYDDPNIAGDLHAFDQVFGLPDPSFSKVGQNGSSSQLPGVDPVGSGPGVSNWEVEEALDVEWAHAMAPAASIILVEANSNNDSDLYTAVDWATHSSPASVVSTSFGESEDASETSLDADFPTGTGRVFVASSGDQGTIEYPSSSPRVLGVGGTTLELTASNTISSEFAWSGSGGGISSVDALPNYQVGVVPAGTLGRGAPDVAYDADPYTGFPIYDSYNNGTTFPWTEVGGTSAGAPQWAALLAIVNEGRVFEGLGRLTGPEQLMPMIYGLRSADFHDLTLDGSRYDFITGLGSPVANLLAKDLASGQTSSFVAVDFPGGGVWRYEDFTGWRQLTQTNAAMVTMDARGDVVAEFNGQGVWRWEDGTGWQQLTATNATNVSIGGAGIVVVDFTGSGVWRFEDGIGWRQLTATDAVDLAVDARGDVVAEFSGHGVWRWEDSSGWQQLTATNATQMAVDARGDVVATFLGQGVWRWEDAIGWQELTGTNAAQVAIAGNGTVVAEFKGQGVWRWEDGIGWQQLTATDATQLAVDARGDLVADFKGHGVWRWEDGIGWRQLTKTDAASMGMGQS